MGANNAPLDVIPAGTKVFAGEIRQDLGRGLDRPAPPRQNAAHDRMLKFGVQHQAPVKQGLPVPEGDRPPPVLQDFCVIGNFTNRSRCISLNESNGGIYRLARKTQPGSPARNSPGSPTSRLPGREANRMLLPQCISPGLVPAKRSSHSVEEREPAHGHDDFEVPQTDPVPHPVGYLSGRDYLFFHYLGSCLAVGYRGSRPGQCRRADRR
jgi:hypothetical protein